MFVSQREGDSKCQLTINQMLMSLYRFSNISLVQNFISRHGTDVTKQCHNFVN